MAFTPYNNSPGTLNLVAAQAALRELYDDQRMISLCFKDNVLLAMLEKGDWREKAQGKYIPQPVVSAPPAGRATQFAAALANQSALSAQSFFLQRGQNHQIVGIDNEVMLATAGDIGSFLSAAKLAIDPALEYLARNINSSLFRDGTGAIGQIGSIATGVITLQSPDDAVQFEVGQILAAAATAGGTAFGSIEANLAQSNATLIATGYAGTVMAVDYDAGTVTVYSTVPGTAATPTSWVAGSFLRTYGDVGSATLPTGGPPPGLAGWIPKVAPTTGDSFFGVDRSVNPSRLAGNRYNGSQLSIEQGVVNALALTNRQGGHPETLIMNFTSFAALQNSLGSKAIYLEHKIGEISFEGFKFISPSGPVSCFADRDCPSKTAYALEMKDWCIWSLGDVPHIDMIDGNSMLRNPTLDAQQIRLAAYYVLGNQAPSHQCVITLSE